MADNNLKASTWELQNELGDDFSVINDSLVICKFCDVAFNVRRRNRIIEHRTNKLHQLRKRSKLIAWTTAASDENVSDDHSESLDYKFHHRESEEYRLRWKDHESTLLRVFNRLFGAEQFTDVVLAAGGHTIRAHKVVLSACSEYFEKLFLEFDEKNQIVILRETSFTDIAAIVEFMYKGEVNIPQNQLSSLLRTAKTLQVKGLTEASSNDATDDYLHLHHQTHPVLSNTEPLNMASRIESSPNDFHGGGSANGDPPAKRKRGRPRTTEADVEPLFNHPETKPNFRPEVSISDETSAPGNSSGDFPWMSDPSMLAAMGSFGGAGGSSEQEEVEPTPGGPLTEERIKTLGVIKMNDYIKSGTRQQFWEEYYVRVVMQAVRNKEIDMKGGAELLGVSYGTLYGRYRELFGYVKHGWNGRPVKSSLASAFPPASFLTDPSNLHIFEQLKDGKITIHQAAGLLGIDVPALTYQLSGKTNSEDESNNTPYNLSRNDADNNDEDDAPERDAESRVSHLGGTVTIRRIMTQQRRSVGDEDDDGLDSIRHH